MAARKCPRQTCQKAWPVGDEKIKDETFKLCPECGTQTVYEGQTVPNVEDEEAGSLARHLAFEEFYAERGSHEVPGALDRVNAQLAEVAWLESIPVDGEPLQVEPLPRSEFGRDRHLLTRGENE